MMRREEYIITIREAMEKAGTNKPQYEMCVDALATILERRDEVQLFYEKHKTPVIPHTNKAGATNYEQNPAIRLLNDCNKTALLYMRELGLTPQALRRINPEEAAEKKKNKSVFSKMLEEDPEEDEP